MANNTEQFRSGVTLVELMVVLVVTTILAVSLSMAISQSLCFHQRGREEAFVRESLCDVLERLASALEMANEIEDLGDGRWRASYRMEAGGVSFETNHWMRVSAVGATASNRNFAAHIVSSDPSHLPETTREFSADGKQRIAPAAVTNVMLQGNDAVRRIRIVATGVASDGKVFDVVGERPVRLWNLK